MRGFRQGGRSRVGRSASPFLTPLAADDDADKRAKGRRRKSKEAEGGSGDDSQAFSRSARETPTQLEKLSKTEGRGTIGHRGFLRSNRLASCRLAIKSSDTINSQSILCRFTDFLLLLNVFSNSCWQSQPLTSSPLGFDGMG